MSAESAARQIEYTWADYRTWPDDQRWEIIGGEAYAMTPAPTPRHQTVLLELVMQMRDYFRGKTCRVFVAPIDVKLSDHDVVQPDIVVVCKRSQIKSTHIEGPPALAVEILSPSSATHDRVRKMALYARSGIKEVWLITPYPWLAEVFVLDGDTYRLKESHDNAGILRSAAFRGLKIDLKSIFDYPIEPDEKVWMIKEGHPPYGNTYGSDGNGRRKKRASDW